jgi:hypothetical protein
MRHLNVSVSTGPARFPAVVRPPKSTRSGFKSSLFRPRESSRIGSQLHELNLNEAIRVLQSKLPVVFIYSWLYQKVQSSFGSTLILL